jgi:MipA family protein
MQKNNRLTEPQQLRISLDIMSFDIKCASCWSAVFLRLKMLLKLSTVMLSILIFSSISMFPSIVLASTNTLEEQLCEVDDLECLNQGEWNLQLAAGIGIQVNPLLKGKNTPLILLPYVSYQKGAFFVENLQIGYTFLNQGKHTVSVIGDANSDAFYFKEFAHVALYNNSPGNSYTGEPSQPVLDPSKLDRRLSYSAGLEWQVNADNHQLALTYLDALSTHYDGQEARATYQFKKKLGTWIVNPSFAAHWQSEASNDYYYGLDANEDGSTGIYYQAKSGTNYLLQLNLVNQFSSTASFLVKWRIEKFASSITKSPLVEKSQAMTLFAGVIFKF